MSNEEIIEIIKQHVKSVCENDSSGHDWWHIYRVYNNAILINKKEKANEFIIALIVLMHDLYDEKFYSGDQKIALKNLLQELNIYNSIPKEDITNIIDSCVNLAFSKSITEKHELSKEGKIVQDADRLDALGAISIARTFTYGGDKGLPIYDPNITKVLDEKEYKKTRSKTSINHFYDKVLKVKNLMNTDTAKRIAIHRHEFVEKYLKEFFDEWNGIC